MLCGALGLVIPVIAQAHRCVGADAIIYQLSLIETRLLAFLPHHIAVLAAVVLIHFWHRITASVSAGPRATGLSVCELEIAPAAVAASVDSFCCGFHFLSLSRI
jgi:hypothetical protein